MENIDFVIYRPVCRGVDGFDRTPYKWGPVILHRPSKINVKAMLSIL